MIGWQRNSEGREEWTEQKMVNIHPVERYLEATHSDDGPVVCGIRAEIREPNANVLHGHNIAGIGEVKQSFDPSSFQNNRVESLACSYVRHRQGTVSPSVNAIGCA